MDDDRSAALAEAYSRGILPSDIKAAYEEAQSRGLVKEPPSKYADYVSNQGKNEKPWTAMDRFAERAIITPALGITQAIGHAVLPDEMAADMDKTVRDREAKYEASRPNVTSVPTTLDEQGRAIHGTPVTSKDADIAGMAGSVLSPFNYALGPMGRGATTLGRVGMAAAQGGAIGAMQPVTEGNGFWGQKAGQVGLGAIAGGAAPAVVEGAAKALSPAIDPLWRHVAGIKGPQAIEDAATREVFRRLDQTVKAGGTAGAQDMLDVLNLTPDKPIVLGDLDSKPVRSLMGRIMRQGGVGSEKIRKFLETRDAATGQRVAEDLNKQIKSGSVYEAADALSSHQESVASPLYKEAFAANQQVESSELSRVLDTPAGRKALGQARIKMQNDMTLMAKTDPELTALKDETVKLGLMEDPQTGVGIGKGLKLRTWDYVKRSLDDQINAARRAGEKDDARILTGLKNKLVSELDDLDVTSKPGIGHNSQGPGAYARARASWSGPERSKEALELGQSFLKRDPEEIEAEVKSLSSSDRELYKLGAAAAMRKNIGEGGPANMLRKLAGKDTYRNEYNLSKLRPLFGSDQEFTRFADSIKAEKRMGETAYDVMGNSKTAERKAEDASPENKAFSDAAEGALSLSRGDWYGTAKKAWRALDAISHRADPELNANMADILTTPLTRGPSPGLKLLQEFSNFAPQTRNYLKPYAVPLGQLMGPGVAAYATDQE